MVVNKTDLAAALKSEGEEDINLNKYSNKCITKIVIGLNRVPFERRAGERPRLVARGQSGKRTVGELGPGGNGMWEDQEGTQNLAYLMN